MSSAPLPADPKHKGTLACVVLKAKNLPNKRSIGKQDPFAVLSIGNDKQKTKPDKRGGQHPTWDEQLHFEIYDDVEDVIKAKKNAAGSNGTEDAEKTTPTSTVKAGSNSKASSSTSSIASVAPLAPSQSTGKKILKVACYADDNREPDFIGEGLVDLTGVLKMGEFDEWVTIKSKDRYAGEVYLELTFYSSAPRPRKTKKPKPPASLDPEYGGRGTFTADVDESDFGSGSGPRIPAKEKQHPRIPSSMMPGEGAYQHGRMSTAESTPSLAGRHHQHGSGVSSIYDIPPTLRPSSSLAGLATYTPPYAPQNIHRASSPQPPANQSTLTSSTTMPSMGFDDRIRRQSFVSSQSRPDLYQGYHSVDHLQGSGQQQMPSSFSTSSMASVGTVRPSSTQPPTSSASAFSGEDPIQDLIRPLSSMSVGAGPASGPYQYHHSVSQQGPHQAQTPGPSVAPTFGPPSHSYSTPHVPQWQSETGHLAAGSRVSSQAYPSEQSGPMVAPTPPPQPNSAPPLMAHHHQALGPQQQHASGHAPASPYYAQHQQQAYPSEAAQNYPQDPNSAQVHPAQTFVPTHGSTTNLAGGLPPAQQHSARAPSPAPAPTRPLSSSGYHALPPLPTTPSFHNIGNQSGSVHSSSPAPRPPPLPTPPPPQQQQLPSHSTNSVINAQSLYHQPPPSVSPYDVHGATGGRAPSPVPPMSAFSQSTAGPHHTGYSEYPMPGSGGGGGGSSRPLPPVTPQPQQNPASQAGSYFGGQTSAQQPPHQGQPYQSEGYGSYTHHPPSRPSSTYQAAVAPLPSHQSVVGHAEQPTYIHSPYDVHSYAPQQQQQSATAYEPVGQHQGYYNEAGQHQYTVPAAQQQVYAPQPPPPTPQNYQHHQYQQQPQPQQPQPQQQYAPQPSPLPQAPPRHHEQPYYQTQSQPAHQPSYY